MMNWSICFIVYHLRSERLKKCLHIILVTALVLAITMPVMGQNQNLETSVPANFSAEKSTISISGDHYKAGVQSLKWSWEAGAVLKIDTPKITSSRILDFSYHTFDFWVYSPSVAKDTFRVQFLDSAGRLAYNFDFINCYQGWQLLRRSYLYDMHRVGTITRFAAVVIRAPSSGTGTLYVDDINWCIPRAERKATPSMPDVDGYMSDGKALLNASLWLPDIKATVPDERYLADMDSIRKRIISSIGTEAPSAASIITAKTAYASYNIIRTGTQIRGKVITPDQLDTLDNFMLTLASAYYFGKDTSCGRMAIDLTEHLLDQGFSYGSIVPIVSYSSRNIGRSFMLMLDAYDSSLRQRVADMLPWQYNFYDMWNPTGLYNCSTDNIYVGYQIYAAGFFFQNTNEKKDQYLRGFQRYMSRILSISNGYSDWIHRDYLGFHHNAHYNAYMYAYNSTVNIFQYLDQTNYQIGINSYKLLRNALVAQYTMSNTTTYANSLCGRHPFAVNASVPPALVLGLAKVGGHIMGTGSRDDQLAAMYIRIWGADDSAILSGLKAEDATGFYQFNYAPMGIYRSGNSVVTIKGMNRLFWGAEIYRTENRYGRYQSYGTIEVMYPGDPYLASGMSAAGYNWNLVPGTTTIWLPYDKVKASSDREDQYNTYNFCGALAMGNRYDDGGIPDSIKGTSGIFGMNFRQIPQSPNHNSSFVFRKSVFAHHGLLVALGSDIANNDTGSATITTLFQTRLITARDTVISNGTSLTSFPVTVLSSGTTANWVINSKGTGYFIAPGDSLILEKKNNVAPMHSGTGIDSANISYAVIAHGKAPAAAGYEFSVLPATTPSAMRDYAAKWRTPGKEPYTVLQKDSFAHIVRFNDDTTTGFVLFKPNSKLSRAAGVQLLSNTAPCLIMTKRDADTLHLSLCNPDLNFTTADGITKSTVSPVTITISCKWKLIDSPANVLIVAVTDSTTQIRFQTIDGFPTHISLLFQRPALNMQLSTLTKGDTDSSLRVILKFTNAMTTVFPAENLRVSFHCPDSSTPFDSKIIMKPIAGLTTVYDTLFVTLATAYGYPSSFKMTLTETDSSKSCRCDTVIAVMTAVALPLQFLHFDIVPHSCSATLNWEVAEQKSVNYFIPEASADGVWFTALGHTAVTPERIYRLNTPLSGQRTYFRIKTVLSDDNYSYSPVRFVDADCNTPIKMIPNPAREQITLSGLMPGDKISIVGTTGKEMKHVTCDKSTITIPLTGLVSGIYIVQAYNNAGIKLTSFPLFVL